MKTRMFANLAIAIATALAISSVGHAEVPRVVAPAATQTRLVLHEIPDPELALMRGRFMIGNNTVAYFGVSMTSSWITTDGQALNGSVTLGMLFAGHDGQAPVITFTPTMNIMRGAPASATGTNTATRSVDGSGLANVNGLVQGIQVAGDGNRAVNVTALKVSHGTGPTDSGGATSTSGAFDSQLDSDGAHVAIAFDPARGVSLNLGVDGQGFVSQWIRTGSVGQLVQLSSDGQSVSNQLRLDLVLNDSGARNQALLDASRSLLQSRLVGAGG